jgi:methylthioxylose transferase
MPSINQRLLWGFFLAAVALSLAVSIGIVRESFVIGSEEGDAIYRYLQPFRLATLATALAVAAVAALLLVPSRATAGWPTWLQLGLWLIVALVLQWALRALTPFTIEQMFVSDGANAFYGVTRHYYPDTVLREFQALRESWPLHAQSNMPGKIMLVYALKSLTRRPDVLAWLVIAVSNLGAVLMFWFTRDLFRDHFKDGRVALWSAVLYFFVPGKLYFFPLMNAVTPVIILLCACLLQRWLMTGRAVFAALLGIALYALAFFEPLPLVMGLLFAALVGQALYNRTLTWRTCVTHAAVAIISFGMTYVLVLATTGFNLLPALRTIAAHATAFNEATGRPYGTWVRQNLLDFMIGVGVCQAVLIWVALADGLMSPALQGRRAPIVLVCGSLVAVLLVTDLLGVNRGEVVRLWIFLACFWQIPAAYVCARLESGPAIALALLTGVTLLQDALGTAMIGFVLPG